MKKVLSLILALVLCLSLFAILTACSTKDDSSQYVGVWKIVDGDAYMYIYEDGTGNFYDGTVYYNSFTWEIEGDYFVRHSYGASGSYTVSKYTLKDGCLLNSQKKIVYSKHSNDTTVDVE